MRGWLCLAAALAAVQGQPVRPHPSNPHYFLFRGQPLVIVSSGEHYGAVLNQDFDWRKYLDTLAKEGMNYTRVFTGTYREVPGDFGIERNTLAPAAGKFLAPWAESGGKFDMNQWNEAYFAKLKDFIGEAGKRGIIVEVTLFCSTYGEKQRSVSPFNGAVKNWKDLNTLNNGEVLGQQEKLVRRIVRELNTFDNVIFEIQNEPWADRTVVTDQLNPYMPKRWPNTVDVADEASLEWQKRIAQWIRGEEAGLANRHMIAWNVCNFRSSLKGVLEGTDSVNFHYAYPEAAQWNYGLNVPIGYDETGFIGNSDVVYRKQAWRFMLAGGSLFNHLDYSFSVGKEDGTDSQPKSPGGGSPALRKQFRVVREFLESLPFLRMRPDAQVVVHAPGAAAVAMGARGEAYAVYLTGSGPGDLVLQLPAGEYKVEWVEPASGSVVEKKPLAHRGGEVRLKTPAFAEDAAVRIRK